MATRALIGIVAQDGSVAANYCHHGDPHSVADVLLNHYRSQAQVEGLMALGPLHSIGPTPDDEWTRPIRPQPGDNTERYPDRTAMLEHPDVCGFIEHIYLYQRNCWIHSERISINPARYTEYGPLALPAAASLGATHS